MGLTASLLAKAAPSLTHHSSIGNLSQPMTIFLELWTSLTNYEHIGQGKYPVRPKGRCFAANRPTPSYMSKRAINKCKIGVEILDSNHLFAPTFKKKFKEKK